MNQMTNPVTSLPDTLNGFIFNTDSGVVSSSLSHDLAARDLEGIGRILSRLYTMVRTEPVTDIRLVFDSVCVTVRQTAEDSFAVIVSDPSVSEGEVAARMDRHIPAFFRDRAGSPLPGGPPQAQDPEEQLRSGPVAGQLQALSSLLFQWAGPVARVIFRDALRQWLGSGPPCAERLEDLVRILMQEIGDPEKALAYRAELPRDLTTWETN
jgi:hypothetical protein